MCWLGKRVFIFIYLFFGGRVYWLWILLMSVLLGYFGTICGFFTSFAFVVVFLQRFPPDLLFDPMGGVGEYKRSTS